MAQRRILQLADSGLLSVAVEATFESEERLHRAIAEHPEVLPGEDVGLGQLVTVANELDLGHGPLDTLAVDSTGRLAIIEFKRGSENPDVRKVVAQVLDYGSSLWRLPYEELESAAQRCAPGFDGTLVDHVRGRLAALGVETFDGDACRRGMEMCLDTGEFVFLYVARNLDERTKRIMTYLAEGPRMTFFAVEVDYFRGVEGGATLVPRVAFVPSWVAEPTRVASAKPALLLEDAPAVVRELAGHLDETAARMGLVVSQTGASRIYRPATGASGVVLYLDGSRIEFDLASFRRRGEDAFAEQFLDALTTIAGRPIKRGPWPGLSPPAPLLEQWDRAGTELVERYFAGRLEHMRDEGGPQPLDVDRLHELLRSLPPGKWATYGDVADAVGSHPRALGGHIANCTKCENAWRVLQSGGTLSPAFRWGDPDNTRDPRELLSAEGVRFLGDRAHPDDQLSRSELTTFT